MAANVAGIAGPAVLSVFFIYVNPSFLSDLMRQLQCTVPSGDNARPDVRVWPLVFRVTVQCKAAK